MARTIGRAAALLSIGLLLGACSSGTSTSSGGGDTAAPGGTSTPAGGTTPGTAMAKAERPRHVFVVNLENESYDLTFGADSKAPYLSKELPTKGQLLTQYYGIAHASLGNYLAQISGQAPNPTTQGDCPDFVEFEMTGTAEYGQAVGKGCVYPTEVETVADQLEAKGLEWKGYMEDMANSATEPKTCRHPAIGAHDENHVARVGDQYATRHNPFVYFHSIIDDQANCDARVVDLTALEGDLATAATTPNLVYITPNLCHDGHDEPCVDGEPGGLVSADAFLAEWVPKITSSPAFSEDGLLIVTFDEAEIIGPDADPSGCCGSPAGPNSPQPGIGGPGGGRVGAVVLSPFVEPGSVNDTPYNHYALLCSIEELFGLEKLGMASVPGLACFGSDVYNAGTDK